MKGILILALLFAVLKADFSLHYYDNKEQLNDVLETLHKDFTPIEAKKNIGTKNNIWLRVNIHNDLNTTRKSYLALSKIQFLREITFYSIVDGELIKQTPTYTRDRYKSVENRIGNTIFYENDIAAKTSMNVYIHIQANSHIYYEIYEGDFYSISAQLFKNSLILLTLLSVLIAFGVYYTFLFILTPNKEYGYYSFLILSIFISSMYLYGGFADYFDLFNTYKFSLIFTIFIPIFTILFFQAIYKDEKEFQKHNKILNIALALLTISLIAYILGRLGVTPHISIKYYTTYIFPFQFIIVMYVSIALYRKKIPYSGLFLISYSANFIGSLTSTFFFIGLTPYNFFTLYANVLGGLIEAVLLSTLMTYKIKRLYKQKEEMQLQAQTQKAQLDIMDKTISFIEHQWRQPLAYINASVIKVDNILFKHKIELEQVEQELEQIEQTTAYMSETISDYRKLFENDANDTFFIAKELITKSLSVLQKDIENTNAEIEVKFLEGFKVRGAMSEMLQVIIIILSNALEVFKQGKIEKPKIAIRVYKKDDNCFIEIEDNGGGIEGQNISKIFDIFYTSKAKSTKSGLGLYIAKLFIEFKMQGKLDVINKNEGACFIISLKENNE